MLFTNRNILACLLFFSSYTIACAQQPALWNQKKCAVVLTYDDAIDGHLDNVLPALDSLQLKGTFYLIGSAPAVNNRIPEWRHAAQEGHELGNHTLFHPCNAQLPGRAWVQPDHDLSKYTINRAVTEIRANNTLLKAIDGKDKRTFAFPCGDLRIEDTSIYEQVKKEFIGARGVSSGLHTAEEIKMDNIPCFSIQNQPASYMINLVNEAIKSHTLLVFLFHGVGGGHSINEGLAEHSQLLHYLKQHESEIWVAPMAEVAAYMQQLKN